MAEVTRLRPNCLACFGYRLKRDPKLAAEWREHLRKDH